ncbi:hypothetical protein [Motilibacter peucedani]|uniref:hypothetical protein n=1 Tax=Motilibacter peucedani TaxID=598650 RepID=UPI0011C48237|nr:hypothetical protein [Motilibacter peucedani]
MRADPLAIAAWELVTGELRTEELPALAVEALGRGVDSPTLGELAAQSPSDVRASRDLFVRVLDELGIELPDQDRARWNLVRETARAVVEAEIVPEAGARRIWRWASEVEDSGDLRIFVGLASELEDHPEDRALLETQVLAEAVELLQRSTPRVWIKLMAVNGGSGLSRSARDGAVGVDPADLAISEGLRSDLAAWNAQHAWVMAGWPERGGFESATDAERFVDAGRQLVSKLQAELGQEYHVEYMPEPIRPPGVRLRSA